MRPNEGNECPHSETEEIEAEGEPGAGIRYERCLACGWCRVKWFQMLFPARWFNGRRRDDK